MHVDDVVVAGSELATQGDRSLGEGGEVGDGAIRPDPHGPPERNEVIGSLPELGVGAVQASADCVWRVPGSEHADMLSSGDELLRKRLDVPVDPSLVGPGIGGDKRYAHGARVPVLKAELS